MNEKNKSVAVSGTGQVISEIPLGQLARNPLNPRQHLDKGCDLAELMASIKSKGVLVPIIVRPRKDGTSFYQIVAGERRFLAAQAVGLATIPACIRFLTDAESYEIMLIENLQRVDLTDLEEAKTFKDFAETHQGDVQALAEKTGINPRYIRARIAVLALPANILAAWEKGTLTYGHLEQFLKLLGQERIQELFKRVKDQELSAAQLKKEIGGERIPLAMALFDVKESCKGCRANSTAQEDLFGLGDTKGAACFNPKCFKAHQLAWLTASWPLTSLAKKYGTKGVRFECDSDWNKKETFHSGVGVSKKCLDCVHFVSLIKLDGKIEDAWRNAQVCVGDKACFKAQVKAAAGEARGEKKKKAASTTPSGKPRVAWHGEFFRNLFYRKRVPEILRTLKPEDPKLKTLLVMCLAHANTEARTALAVATGRKTGFYSAGDSTLFSKFLALPYAKVAAVFQKAVEAVFLEGQNVGEYSGFGSTKRRLVADFLGVNLAKEFAATEEYLGKKTKNELVAFGKKSGLLTGPKARDYMAKTLKKKPDALDSLKKSELIDIFLKSGVELVGYVPDEILSKCATKAARGLLRGEKKSWRNGGSSTRKGLRRQTCLL